MRAQWPDALILFSCTTESAYKDAQALIPEADHIVYLPLDLSCIIRPIVRRVRPNLVVLSETDLWFHFLDEAQRGGAKVVVVNGKLSERSYKRYRKLGALFAPFWRTVDLFCLQNALYRQRLANLGIEPARLEVTGDLKMDAVFPKLDSAQVGQWRARLGLAEGQPLLVVGSTHAPEEELLLPLIQQVRRTHTQLKVVFVPRHLERVPSVIEIFKSAGVACDLWSGIEGHAQSPYALFDVMGQLRALYQLATLAIVAGSFTPKVGGHNLLEPSYYGVPTLYGPYVHTQSTMDEWVTQYRCGKKLELNQLAETLSYLLDNPSVRAAMGHAGKQLFNDARGATERTWQCIKILLATAVVDS
jgi:3-deoxy-D-manno-octulosonic-acid transferase